MTPRRFQRRRVKGYRMPEGAVYVGRPTRHGNPFRVGAWLLTRAVPEMIPIDHALAVALHAAWARRLVAIGRLDLSDLRGRDVVCWCRLDQPCHADVLIELANA